MQVETHCQSIQSPTSTFVGKKTQQCLLTCINPQLHRTRRISKLLYCWPAKDLHCSRKWTYRITEVTYCVMLNLAVMQVSSLFLLQQVLQALKLVYVEWLESDELFTCDQSNFFSSIHPGMPKMKWALVCIQAQPEDLFIHTFNEYEWQSFSLERVFVIAVYTVRINVTVMISSPRLIKHRRLLLVFTPAVFSYTKMFRKDVSP